MLLFHALNLLLHVLLVLGLKCLNSLLGGLDADCKLLELHIDILGCIVSILEMLLAERL